MSIQGGNVKTIEYKVKIHYPDNGKKWSEQWFLNDKYHREDGPAYQEWYDNGQKYQEEWYLNGQLHRKDGPAIQLWFSNGLKCSEDWYFNGVELSEQEFKLRTDPEYKKYLELKKKFG